MMRVKTGLILFQKHVEPYKSPQHDRTEFRVEDKELTLILLSNLLIRMSRVKNILVLVQLPNDIICILVSRIVDNFQVIILFWTKLPQNSHESLEKELISFVINLSFYLK